MIHSDPVVQKVCELAKQIDGIESLILFGSRSRGDFASRSDYDIAVQAKDAVAFSRFYDLVQGVETLLTIDLIHLNEECGQELKE
jgi:uncharacterized protein